MNHWKLITAALIVMIAAAGITVAAPSAPDIFPGEILVKFKTQITGEHSIAYLP